MKEDQVMAMQRAKIREAIGILRGVEEMFGICGAVPLGADGMSDYQQFNAKVSEFEAWVDNESSLA